jgi:hypothetical protein
MPAQVPRDWDLMVISMGAGEGPDLPARVVLSYRSRNAATSLTIMETSRGAPAQTSDGSGMPPFEDIEREGVQLRIRGRTSEWPQSEVALVRDGTAINMFSGELDAEALASLALSLVPAPEAPPDLD